MRQKLNMAGLALIAVLALNALSASAQANNVTASKYPASLVGTSLNTEHGKLGRLTFGAGARFIECTVATLNATLSAATTKVTVTPTYSSCFSNGLTAVPVTVTMNSCDYVMEATSKTAGQITIACTKAGDAIEVHVYENAAKHTSNTSMCTYRIGAQGPITGAHFTVTNAATSTEDLDIHLNSLAAFKVSNTVGAAGLCGIAAGKEGTGTLRDTYTVSATESGVHVATMIE